MVSIKTSPAYLASNYLKLDASNDPLTNTLDGANFDFTGHAAIGADASVGATTILDIDETLVFVDTTGYGIFADLYLEPAGALSAATHLVAMDMQAQWNGAVDGSTHASVQGIKGEGINRSATQPINEIIGVYGKASNLGVSDVTEAIGGLFFVTNDDAIGTNLGDVANAYSILARAYTDKDTGVITDRYGLYIEDTTGGGLLTNQYGIYIEDMDSGSASGTVYSIYSLGGNVELTDGDLTTLGTISGGTLTDGTATITGGAISGSSLVIDSPTLVVNATGYENYVGIGTATPSQPLDVLLGANEVALITGNVTADMSYGLAIFAGTSATDYAFNVENQSGATSFFQIDGVGDINCYAGNITTTGTIGGINVTSGADPGHTHTATGLPDVETLSTSLTAGSVVFSDGSNLAEDNSNLFWDDTNNRLGIGTSTPVDTLTVSGNVDILHTSVEADDHALELDVDAAGYGDVKAIDINYCTGAIAMGQDEAVMLLNIAQCGATGGDVFGLEILATDSGSAGIYGLKTGAGIGPVHQDSGTFANPTTGTDNTPSTDVPAMIDGSTGTTTAIFENDNEYIIIGSATAFEEMEFILTTTANVSIKPTFWYSTAGTAQFTQFTPVDGTNGFKNTGVIAWDASDLTGHVADDVTGTFDIKIIRTRNNLTTSPILGYAKTAATTEYLWDKDGKITINNLESTVATGTAPFIVASTTLVSNLNADLLDSQEGSYYLDSANFTGTNWTDLTNSGDTTLHDHDGISENTTHRGSDGSDHSFIDQSVTSGSSPTLDGTNFTGIPDGAMDTDYVEVAGDTMTGALLIDGTADVIQLKVQGHSTQNANVFEVEDSDGVDVFTVDSGGNAFAKTGFYLVDGAKAYYGTGNDGEIYSSSDDLYIANVTQDKDIFFNVNDGGSTTTPLFIDGSTGNVGIGTTGPESALHVAGAINATPDTVGVHMGMSGAYAGIELFGTSGSSIDFNDTANQDAEFRLLHSSSTWKLRAGSGTNMIEINRSGNMGFFAASPVAKPTGVAVSAAGIHAALVSLGLIAA